MWLVLFTVFESFQVAQLVKALRYKLEGRGFDSRWYNFLLAESVRLHYGLGIDSVTNRNEYQEYFLVSKGGRFLGLRLLPSCADCLEIGEPQPLGTLRACNSPVQGLLTWVHVVEQRTSVSVRTERDISGTNGKNATYFYDTVLCNFCMKFGSTLAQYLCC